MYTVSEKYMEEIRKPQRITRIIGRIRTAAGTDYTITDDNVITGSLKITDQLGSGEFSIGGVYTRNITVKLLGFSNVTDVSNLSNARIVLRFRLVYGVDEDGNEDYEDVPLGVFSVDGSKTKRKFDIVTITATDNMQNFDRDAEPNENITLYNAVALACERCGVALATSAEEFAGFPNGDLTVTYTTDQIQTWRDLLMWIGELTGTFARINYGGALEFVKMTAETGSDGRIIPVAEIPPDVRFTTDFSDTNIRVLKVIMRRGKTELSASSSLKITNPSTMVATMELNDNPLIADKTDEEVSGYLKNLVNYLVTLLHRPFETSFNGNPALQVGDYVRLRDGAIDISQAYATGIITYSCWRYRGKHDIKCKSFTTTIRQSDSSAIAFMSIDDTEALEEAPAEIMRRPKSQLEKELDALRGKTGTGGVGKAAESDPTSEYFNDYENNKIVTYAAGYHHVEGKDNKCGPGLALHVGGVGNVVRYGTALRAEGSGNTLDSGTNSSVGGNGNIVKNVTATRVDGTGNTVEHTENSYIIGKENKIEGMNGILAGEGNEVSTGNFRAIFGMHIKGSSSVRPRLIIGEYNQPISGVLYTTSLAFEIGCGNSYNRKSCFAVDYEGNVYCNKVIETGTDNILGGAADETAISAQAARAITSAASAGIPIVLLDHAPTANDLTGSECVFLQCDDTASVEGETTGIFRVTDIFAEKSLQ